MIEMHFHVFISITILLIYKDVMPMLTALGAVVVHHFLFNYCQAGGVTWAGVPIMLFAPGASYVTVLVHGALAGTQVAIAASLAVRITDSFIATTDLTVRLGEEAKLRELAHQETEDQRAQERDQDADLRAKVDRILRAVEQAGQGQLHHAVDVSGEDAIGLLGEGLSGFLDDLRSSGYSR